MSHKQKKIKGRHLFKPHHIPKISEVLIKTLFTPLLAYFTVIGNILMFLSAYGFYHFEKELNPQVNTYGDALWWAICTVSTVGYGDIFPITGWGRIIGAFLIIFGVIFFLSFIAALASVMSTLIRQEE